MTQRQCSYLNVAVGLIAVLTLMGALMPPSAHAAIVNGAEDCVNPDPTLDTDGDGFSNAQECNGITVQVTGASLPSCGANQHTNLCLNPNEQDVVIFLFPADPSKIPPNTTNSPYHPFDIVRNLGVVPHIFTNPAGVSQTNRAVTGTHNGVVVFEDLDETAIAMGRSKWGSVDLATNEDTRIFTQKIICFVNQQYNNLPCTDTTHADIYNQYILRTSNHEVSHMLALANHYDGTLGNHYPDTSAYLMNKNVTVTKKGTKITWSIPTTYTASEPGQDCYIVSTLDANNNGVCAAATLP